MLKKKTPLKKKKSSSPKLKVKRARRSPKSVPGVINSPLLPLVVGPNSTDGILKTAYRRLKKSLSNGLPMAQAKVSLSELRASLRALAGVKENGS